ncbi:hypothetical protein ACV0ZS_004944 [Escherichia coli]
MTNELGLPPLDDSAPWDTGEMESASGLTGTLGTTVEGVVTCSNPNGSIVADSPAVCKVQNEWETVDNVLPGYVEIMLRVRDTVVYDGYEWRKKPGCDYAYERRQVAVQNAPEQAESSAPEQTESQPETVSEKAVQDDEATGKPEQTSEKGIYCSYVCLGAARKAFIRTGYSADAKATTWGVLSSIAAAARKQNDGSWVAEVRQSDIAAEWGIARRTVIRQMQILGELGLIEPCAGYVVGQHAKKYRLLFQVENAR